MIAAIPEKFPVQGKRFYAPFLFKNTLWSTVHEVPEVEGNRLSVCGRMMSANKEFKALSRRERIAVAYVCTVLGIGSTFILSQQEVMVLFLAVQGLHGADGKVEEGAGSCWGPLIQNRAGACGWAQRQCVGIAIPGNTCVQGSDD